MYNYIADVIALEITKKFRTFGGGFEHRFKTPVTEALKDKPLSFAAGVDVLEVVEFVIDRTLEIYNRPIKRTQLEE